MNKDAASTRAAPERRSLTERQLLAAMARSWERFGTEALWHMSPDAALKPTAAPEMARGLRSGSAGAARAGTEIEHLYGRWLDESRDAA